MKSLLLVGVLACGARTETRRTFDATPGNDDFDATSVLDASADVLPDSKWKPCKTNEDCPHTVECQMGICCRGTVMNGDCRCGDAPGCDVLTACCVRTSEPYDATPHCIPADLCKRSPN